MKSNISYSEIIYVHIHTHRNKVDYFKKTIKIKQIETNAVFFHLMSETIPLPFLLSFMPLNMLWYLITKDLSHCCIIIFVALILHLHTRGGYEFMPFIAQ